MNSFVWEPSYAIWIAAGFLVLLLLSWLWIFLLSRKVARLQKKQQKLIKGTAAAEFADILGQQGEDIQELQKQVGQILQRLEEQHRLLQKSIGSAGIVRFNAFADSGGQLSFAIALLDREKNGVVISSIYGREEQRIYAKPIKKGSSDYMLSEEEQAAMEQAMEQMGERMAVHQ